MMPFPYLFNFAASYGGGGHKRLSAYVRWFHARGGATFIIHPLSAALIKAFPNNHYHVVNPSRLQRLIRDCGYLAAILRNAQRPDVYYAYGIPMYQPVARLNWFHLSNLLPLNHKGIPLSPLHRLKVAHLGRRIKATLHYADVISAESLTSLKQFPSELGNRLHLSVNGNDDELAHIDAFDVRAKENVAVVLGTFLYKGLRDSFEVFSWLRQRSPDLELVIIGGTDTIPKEIRGARGVTCVGLLPRREVFEWLGRARYYISTTYIENSFNAAAEGVYFADESFISDIGPHRELLAGQPFEVIRVPGIDRKLLQVRRVGLSSGNLNTWDAVVADMVAEIDRRSGSALAEWPAAPRGGARHMECK